MLVPFVESSMRRMAALKATATRLEIVASAKTLPVDASQEFRGRVAVEVW